MKEAVQYTTILVQCKARQVYMIYLVLNKEMAQTGQLWPGATKVNLKNLKT